MTQTKPSFVSDTQNTANNTPMSLALREMQRDLRGPVFWIIVGAAILLAAMAGPYYTLARLSFPERLVYWGTTVTISAILMTFLTIYAYRITDAYRWNWFVVAVLAGIVGILPVVGTVYLAEGLATGFASLSFDSADLVSLSASVATPLIAVTVVVSALSKFQFDAQLKESSQAKANEGDLTVPLTLLQGKLPHHLGHDIISVQAQDHYVEVTTPLGSAMVLMRLGDAVRDLEHLGGLQVHRSWWINLAHVTRKEKGAGGLELILSSDQRIPVGRSFRSALKGATQD